MKIPIYMLVSPSGEVEDGLLIIVPVILTIGFILVFCALIARTLMGAKQWKNIKESPVLTVNAKMSIKRNVSHRHHNMRTNIMHPMPFSTKYFATFELDGGEKIEFEIRDTEYDALVENHKGKLTFKGTRYIGFESDRYEYADEDAKQ